MLTGGRHPEELKADVLKDELDLDILSPGLFAPECSIPRAFLNQLSPFRQGVPIPVLSRSYEKPT